HNWADVIGNATTPSIAGDPASSGGGAGSGATGGVSYKGTFGTPLGAGTYRLRIDALDWNGFRPGPTDDGASASDCSWAGKSYSVRVADTQVPSKPCSQAGSLCPNVSLTALNDMTIFTPTKNTFDMPLF